MYKISVNNKQGRFIFFVIGSFPIFFYSILSHWLKWDIELSIGLFIYFVLALLILFVVLKYCFFDWDFYVSKGRGFVFKRFGNVKEFQKDLEYVIKSVPIMSFHFNVMRIEFNNGAKFLFRYNKYQIPVDSFKTVIEKIKTEIESKL